LSQLKIEILLPLYYNKNKYGIRKEIEDEKYIETFDELFLQFGGYTVNRDIMDGEWFNSETKQRVPDQTRSVWIVCDDTRENVDFITHLKEILMERFQQDEVFILYTYVNRF
jgi:DeoR/GlpR family transcriptional regulator of sugar metabolism